MEGLLESSETQETTAETQLTRVTEMVEHVDGAMEAIDDMKADVPTAIEQLIAHNQSAYEVRYVE